MGGQNQNKLIGVIVVWCIVISIGVAVFFKFFLKPEHVKAPPKDKNSNSDSYLKMVTVKKQTENSDLQKNKIKVMKAHSSKMET